VRQARSGACVGHRRLEAAEKTGERRLKQSSIGSRASLARRLRELSEAEAAIEQGIHVVRRQNAKSLESRGAMSLARQRRRQGKPQGAARNAVSPWEAGAPRSAASRWEAAANPWLGAMARCSRTGSSNPSPSSGESANFQFLARCDCDGETRFIALGYGKFESSSLQRRLAIG